MSRSWKPDWGADQGKPRVPIPISLTCTSCSTSSKIASDFAHFNKTFTDPCKGNLKAIKVPIFKEKEVPPLSEEEMVVAFQWCCPGIGLASLSLTPAGEVVARGSTFVDEFLTDDFTSSNSPSRGEAAKEKER
ncbi:hypothetical protein Ddye_023412 [Dipteronia dyeriana]|uniref:Uncharacterized protein n=1 Tax=Dipteronia dyeriana TaxID=168575 RepID=A0AAD9TSZ6_9ROSI|nr:hypothetical protein Ddye_023412 [Dipteronia dyeriana]